MKTIGLLYSSENKKHSSSQVLPKSKLKELFPGEDSVTLTINYNRKSYKKHKPKEFGGKGRTSKKQLFMKANYPKTHNKSKIILLY